MYVCTYVRVCVRVQVDSEGNIASAVTTESAGVRDDVTGGMKLKLATAIGITVCVCVCVRACVCAGRMGALYPSPCSSAYTHSTVSRAPHSRCPYVCT
jgi:hypothetical protein